MYQIPGVFGLGPKAELTVSFQSNVRTDADFSFGVTGSVRLFSVPLWSLVQLTFLPLFIRSQTTPCSAKTFLTKTPLANLENGRVSKSLLFPLNLTEALST